ncbi:PTS transporter subunit EIIC [Borreliella afzelii]|uniref:Phosphotransferase system, EIIB family protein n=2 Tax=Borreliella afzelii TaxID=29518 RepID=G0ISI2_BORAP|nr:PTS transporter subunit EIIC [Borreliella afzelii]ACJ73689.1 pts system, iibc component [Borreliella afzelii ACA-1]AEL70086.1 phosphotransferase system, EIIB family protein [Borreliella afzelii PKo]AJY72912.1 phosphotransferase system, EIIB family protein [Borreliella afzelii K78]AIK19153.1 PTS glucose transporter subunit IIB [Borreliella afzelii Tom3107]APJ09257.1 PTS glucose transporter subunit IIB [Borreliella afzelii]
MSTSSASISIFTILQKVGKAFMLPIALLPAAGILLGIGGAFTNETMIQAYGLEGILGKGTVASSILYLMKYTGEVIFANLPLMFAAAIPIGLAKVEKGTAALAGVVGFLVMHQTINGILYIQGITPESASLKALLELGMPETAATAKSQEYTNVLGIFSLQMSVMGGLVAGFVAVFLHNRFYNIQLPTFLAFFGGTRFVPIITTITMFVVGIFLTFIWPFIQGAMTSFGQIVEQSGLFGTFAYGAIKRSLIPFGLHHIFYLPFWQTAVGGTLEINGELISGAQNIFFKQLGDTNTVHFEVAKGTRFFSGEFVVMIFGLPGAALAMYHTSKPENKKNVASLLLSASFTSMLTGITEPLEFAFLFAAPALYYFIYVPLFGLAYLLTHLLNVGVGLTFSGGFIDMFLFGILQGNSKTNWIAIPILGIFYFIGFYFIFKFVIMKFNLKTIGREDEEMEKDISSEKTNLSETALKVLEGLGGKDNITYLDACASRLRVNLKQIEFIKSDTYFKNLGASGILKKGNSVQIVFGGLSDNIRMEIDKLM